MMGNVPEPESNSPRNDGEKGIGGKDATCKLE